MKNILTYALAIIAAVVLAAGAVCIGAVNGWQQERVQASTLGENNQELVMLLDTRAMDAANLAVVASRHLPADDKHLCMLRDAQAVLASGKGTMEELLTADETITLIAREFGRTLPLLPSVMASPRDQVYVSMLTRTLSEGESAKALFAVSAERFNRRMNESLTGRLAMMLGVKPLSID